MTPNVFPVFYLHDASAAQLLYYRHVLAIGRNGIAETHPNIDWEQTDQFCQFLSAVFLPAGLQRALVLLPVLRHVVVDHLVADSVAGSLLARQLPVSRLH